MKRSKGQATEEEVGIKESREVSVWFIYDINRSEMLQNRYLNIVAIASSVTINADLF